MGAKAAGSVFWAVFLVLFPVAVQLSSPSCVTYKHRQACGLKGSSVEFPCSYPNNSLIISISGWSKKRNPNMNPKPLKQMPEYLFRMTYLKREGNDCTMKLTGLKKTDESNYYFVYSVRNVTDQNMTCNGEPGVRLSVFASPVSIVVKKLVRGQGVPVADLTVIEGQRITLTCVPTCAVNLNSNPDYTWYKNRLKLNGSRANSPFLSLDPVSNEDMGSYVCATTGYKDLPSSAVSLTVQRRPTVAPENGGTKNDSVPTLAHGCDAQNSTDQIFNIYQRPKGKSMFTFSIMLGVSVCVGWVIVVMVVILVIRVKKKKKKRRRKRRRCAGSDPGTPNPNNDTYMELDLKSMSADYDTLDTARRYLDEDPVYEN